MILCSMQIKECRKLCRKNFQNCLNLRRRYAILYKSDTLVSFTHHFRLRQPLPTTVNIRYQLNSSFIDSRTPTKCGIMAPLFNINRGGIQQKRKSINNAKQQRVMNRKKKEAAMEAAKAKDTTGNSGTKGAAGPSRATAETAGCAPTASRDGTNLEVYNIKIQQNFDKKVPLPPVDVWDRVIDQSSFQQTTLRVSVRRRGLFFDRQLDYGFFVCILNRQGYLVIYTDVVAGSGYAVNLRKANKLLFELFPVVPASANTQRKAVTAVIGNINSATPSCKFTAKWRFGSVIITLPATKIADWFRAIACAYQLSLPSVPSCNGTLVHRLPTRATGPMPTIASEPDARGEEMVDKQQSSDMEKDAIEAARNTFGFIEQDHGANGNQSDHYIENAQKDNNNAVSSSDSAAIEDLKVSAGVQTEVTCGAECQLTATTASDSGAQQDQQPTKCEEENNAGDEVNGAVPPPGPLKRKVTFSDLPTIIEVEPTNGDEEAPANEQQEKQTDREEETEKKPAEGAQQEEEDEVGCCWSRVMHHLLNSAKAGDNKMMLTNGKEQLVGPALDQMRIVGQHAATDQQQHNDEHGNNEDADGQQEASADAADAESCNNNAPDSPVTQQFPSQADRFALTRRLFEPNEPIDGADKDDTNN